MAVPRARNSRSRTGKRRSHQHITPIQVQYCNNCGDPILPHRLCGNCGHYRDREVVAPAQEK